MDEIYKYTRKQAIDDGVLIDVSELAEEAGLRYPTAVTAAVWQRYVKVAPEAEWQDEAGRLWDILWMCRVHGQRASPKATEILFRLYVANDSSRHKLITLKAVCHGGDAAEPVFTIMLPNED